MLIVLFPSRMVLMGYDAFHAWYESFASYSLGILFDEVRVYMSECISVPLSKSKGMT